MGIKDAIMSIFPEIPELDDVDFSQYSTPYVGLLTEFERTEEKGLVEFQKFVEEKGGSKEVVGKFLISLLQYLLIRYRRYKEKAMVVPAIKVLVTLKGWLIENGYERDWLNILHNFLGYLVDMMPYLTESQEREMADAYLTLIYNLALEAEDTFGEPYFNDLKIVAKENLENLREKYGISREITEK